MPSRDTGSRTDRVPPPSRGRWLAVALASVSLTVALGFAAAPAGGPPAADQPELDPVSHSEEVEGTLPGDDSLTGVPDPGEEAEPAILGKLFPKWACKQKARKVAWAHATGDGFNEAMTAFLTFGCRAETFLPGLVLDDTEALCLLYAVYKNCGTIG